MLDHVAQPSTLPHPQDQAAVGLVGAAVILEAGQGGQKSVGKAVDPIGRPVLQLLQVQLDADHRPRGVEVGTLVNSGLCDAHHAAFAGRGAARCSGWASRAAMMSWTTKAAASFLLGATPWPRMRPSRSIVSQSHAPPIVGAIANRSSLSSPMTRPHSAA